MPRVPASRSRGGIFRPVVGVRLQFERGPEVLVPAVVDSGADDTTMPEWVLRARGIEWDGLEPANRVHGVGGAVEQRTCLATARYGETLFARRVRVVRELRVAVVGRNDFFTTFAVDFTSWNQTPPVFEVSNRS